MEIIGHRGAMGLEPENTLRSFQKALELGVNMVELDVYVLKTGELVLMHDDDVDRTTNGHGKVWDFSFQDLRKLDAGNGEQVPTLEEVLDLIGERAKVNIELKGPATATPVAQVIKEYTGNQGWKKESFVVSSFNPAELRRFKKLCPDIYTGICISKKVPLAKFFASTLPDATKANSINPGIDLVDKKFVDTAHALGHQVYVWTVNDPQDMVRMKECGVDGIFTNFPDRAKEVLRG